MHNSHPKIQSGCNYFLFFASHNVLLLLTFFSFLELKFNHLPVEKIKKKKTIGIQGSEAQFEVILKEPKMLLGQEIVLRSGR